MLAVLNAILVPFEIAFEPEFAHSGEYEAIDLIIECIFAIDMIILFRTSTVNIRTGEEITEPKKIAKDYILSFGFWVDLVCAIPINRMSSSKLLSLIGILKITRVAKISHIIA